MGSPPVPDSPRAGTWEILRAEWRRLREPPELDPAFRTAIRSRPALLALAAPGLVVAVGLLAWFGPRWLAVTAAVGAWWFLGQLANRPLRRRSREEFDADQRQRVERIQARERRRLEAQDG